GRTVERVRRRGEDQQQAACGDGCEYALQQLARHEAAVGICCGIAELAQREPVPASQEREHAADDTYPCCAAPLHVVPPHPHRDGCHHAHEQKQNHCGIDVLRYLVPGAQPLVITRPLVGHLEVLPVPARLVAKNGHFHAVGGVLEVEVALLPGEDVVCARGASNARALDELQRRRIAVELFAEEFFRHGPRLLGGQAGPRGGLGDLVFETDNFSTSGDVDA